MLQEDQMMSNMYHNIQYYLNMIRFSNHPGNRIYYLDLLNNEINQFYNFHKYYIHHIDQSRNMSINNINKMKDFTLEELSFYDGSNGRPAYVAVNGVVYDVSMESTWGGGTHFKLYSGKDLTTQFNSCHNKEVLEKLPKVGMIKDMGDGDE